MKIKYKLRRDGYVYEGRRFRRGMKFRYQGEIVTIRYVPGDPEIREYYSKHSPNDTPESYFEFRNHIVCITGESFDDRNNGYGWNVSAHELQPILKSV